MERIWIIGGGRFGRQALERLGAARPGARFVLVDPRPEMLSSDRCRVEAADGVTFLNSHLSSAPPPDHIVPAAPVHLAAQWCLRQLAASGYQLGEVPRQADACLPNPMRGSNGDVYVSNATFLCPGDCPEPAAACTVTGKARPGDLYAVLEALELPGFQSCVVRSRQLAPGVGGVRPQQFLTLLEQVRAASGNVLVSTACRCHGVVTALERMG